MAELARRASSEVFSSAAGAPGRTNGAWESKSEEIAYLLGSAARDSRILHAPDASTSPGPDKDIDCVVSATDPLWPLRVTREHRVAQRIDYDARGTCWVVDRGDSFLALDLLDDPDGFNRLGFRTGRAFYRPGSHVADPIRAAYLTAKRIFKAMNDPSHWREIWDAAATEPSSYRAELQAIFGRTVGAELARIVGAGEVPDDRQWARARRAQRLRWARRPWRAPALAIEKLLRVFRRIVRPMGFYVLVAGPDGTGKSTLAEALPEDVAAAFKGVAHFHWKPGVLPRPGALLGKQAGDPSDPHGGEPHGSVFSVLLLAYHWVDTLLGHWIKVWPLRVRGRLVILERGWWDISVDPRRYGLKVPERLTRMLARFVPKPDLALVLTAPGSVLFSRKRELSPGELDRQVSAWKDALPRVDSVELDVRQPLHEVRRAARTQIVDRLERRTMARLGAGWSSLPRNNDPRWMVPRGPRRVARTALSIYQPVTTKGRIGWEVGRLAASVGAARLLPRGEAPPRELREAVAQFIPRGSTFTVARANHGSRYVALVIDRRGFATRIVKVALDDPGRKALAYEFEMLLRLGRRLSDPLSAPRIFDAEETSLVMEVVPFRPRLRPRKLPEDVAGALGAFYATGATNGTGPSHGDCAPWNLLKAESGWVLIDWEQAEAEAPAFWDVFHYLVQGHALLGSPSGRELTEGLRGGGWCGRALGAYGDAAGLTLRDASELFVSYLERSQTDLDPLKPDGRAGIEARRVLLAGRSDW